MPMNQQEDHPSPVAAAAAAPELERERYALLHELEDRLEMPMVFLGIAWLVLLVVELVWTLSPAMEMVGTIIWVLFILDFLLKLFLAPHKFNYVRDNWLTVISLVVPALRVFRVARALSVLRAARATRALRLVKVVGSVNRGMRALGNTMSRRGFGYVVALTVVVTFAGAAGMFTFENANPDGRGLNDYGSALWWTAMVMVTMGSEYWPQTGEGRVLCFLLSLYAFAVFGYVTATLATFFIGRDADNDDAEVAGARSVESLRLEIVALREEIAKLGRRES